MSEIVTKETSLYCEILKYLKNKYILTSLLFLTWVLFFDTRSILIIINKYFKINELTAKETHVEKEIANTKIELQQLKSNGATIEKYAREKYYMKKDNEDLYIYENDK